MRKLTLALLLAVLILALVVVPAFAAVHRVSQAGCGQSSNAGATQASDRAPDAQIPQSASEGRSGDGGGDGDGACDVK